MTDIQKNNYSKTNPFLSRIKERYDLCATCTEKNTMHIVLDLKGSDIVYNVGDSLAVLPVNDSSLVLNTLNALKMNGQETVFDKRSEATMPLKDFIAHKCNLVDINKKLLKEIVIRQTCPEKKQALEMLLAPENKESLKEYLEGRHLWDVLIAHPEVSFTPEEFCDFVMPMMPRFYSIASSMKAVGDEVHLTVKNVVYEAHGHKRRGVCTYYICDFAELESPQIPVYVQPHNGFTLPEDSNAPIIMIGPGTGIAPFRAFMQERMISGAEGKNWLFFGEWRREHNFLYGDFWLELEAQGKLRLDVAFSRDQKDKVYVQHLLLERGKEVFEWLEQGAYLYVCGDAKQMAKDVEAALHQIVSTHGGKSDAEAHEYLKSMRKTKRYLRDVY